MKDIFEFKILTNENILVSGQEIIDSFIFFIENHSMYWGGGYSINDINGGLYADENVMININDFVKEFISFFLDLNISIEKMEINIESSYFNSFDYDGFIEIYSSLPITFGNWEI